VFPIPEAAVAFLAAMNSGTMNSSAIEQGASRERPDEGAACGARSHLRIPRSTPFQSTARTSK
jgi:hypothetical protein